MPPSENYETEPSHIIQRADGSIMKSYKIKRDDAGNTVELEPWDVGKGGSFTGRFANMLEDER